MKVTEAEIFARNKHANQTRRDGWTPYIQHPAKVVEILEGFGVTDEDVLKAAWLHDVVEDTDTELKEIGEKFGHKVKDLVFWLTKIEYSTREQSEFNYIQGLKAAPYKAQLIKLADIMANLIDMKNMKNMDYKLDKYILKKLTYINAILPGLLMEYETKCQK